MEGQSESPLKAWVRRHSPLKGRNKPLPSAPRDASPTRKPVQPISSSVLNQIPPAAPPKRKSSSASQTAPPTQPEGNSQAQPKRKLPNFLRRHTSYDDSVIPTKRSRSLSSSRQDSAQINKDNANDSTNVGSQIESPRGHARNGSINRLNQKVSALEAELQEARREIQAMATAHQRAPSPFEYNRLIEARQAALMGTGRYDGLVENLLEARSRNVGPQQFAVQHHQSQPDTRQRSSSMGQSGFQLQPGQVPIRAMSVTIGPGDENITVAEGTKILETDSPNTRKRKRSQMRKAEWERVQKHMAAQQQKDQALGQAIEQRNEEEDRPVRRQKKHHDRELPQLPRDAVTLDQNKPQFKRPDKVSKMPYSKAKVSENVQIFHDQTEHQEQDVDRRPPSAHRRYVTSPSRLDRIQEEYEWDDAEVF